MTTTHRRYFDKKSIYHSNLTYLNDGIECVVKGVMDSKFKANGRVAVLEVSDDETYWLAVENASVEQSFLNAPDDTRVTIRAFGRGDSAAVEIVPVGQNGQEPPPAPRPPHDPEPQEDLVDQMVEALVAAHAVTQRYKAVTGQPLDEHTRALGVSMFINSQRRR